MPSAINIGRPSSKRGNWSIRYAEVTAAQTFKVGDWVYLTTAGTLSIAAASGADVGALKLYGRALANAADCLTLTGDQARCPVDVPGENGEFIVAVVANDSTSGLSLADWMPSTDGLPITLPLRNRSGQWCANVTTNGTNDMVVLVERDLAYPASETSYGWWWARLIDAAKATSGAS